MSLTFADPSAAMGAEEEAALESRINELLGRMTLDEKIGQMRQIHADHDELPADLRSEIAAGRVGSLINAVNPEMTNEAQRVAREESRLGIPLLIGRDVIHGFRTIYPIPLGLAATFDPSLVEATARAAGEEAASKGINWTFAPMIDVTRDPRWGRIAESPGEDPYLASVLAVAMVDGFQGDDLSARDTIAACAKHFAGYGASEAGRDYNTTNIPENELRNVHLVPFHAAVQAGVASIMASFSDLNGVPATGNRWLFRDVLRREWGFKGMTVSDWASIPELADHGFTEDDRGSALAAFGAGIDMEMATTTYQTHLPELLAEGLIDEETLDAMVANILRLKLRLGLFDRPAVPPMEPDPATSQHLELARRAALESLVLLKNDENLLPLDPEAVGSVAVIGPLADSPPDQLGTWIFDGDRSLAVTPLQSLRELSDVEINYVRTLETSRSRDQGAFQEAIDAANRSDVVLLFLGEEVIITGEAHSRADIRLPGAQEELIHALGKLGKPAVLVILAGRPLALQNIVDAVPALLYAWHPGASGGPAIVDVLFGMESP
ncbi:MAG: glycoside hydrolase family 3 N-terminal domain-containing protein, partial [Xanthomonadales bacterium]|nr:glycoside hydrolase family 3 N-terminal domain-containing protein [Xanthomonadales bacterium]